VLDDGVVLRSEACLVLSVKKRAASAEALLARVTAAFAG
jgi:hypothetical protein